MVNIKAIKNAKIVLENGIIFDGVLIIENDRILNFGKSAEVEIPECAEVIDAKGAYVGPGFVDIHVHGGGGHQTSTEPALAAEHFTALGHNRLCMIVLKDYADSELRMQGFMDTVKEIAPYAFEGCSSLSSVTLSANIRFIGNNAFLGCSSLTDVSMTDSSWSIINGENIASCVTVNSADGNIANLLSKTYYYGTWVKQ